MNIIEWIKTLFQIVREYKQLKYDLEAARKRAEFAVQIIQERTDLHVDMAFTKQSHTNVILVGRYRGRDYVEVHTIDEKTFEELIPMLKDMEQSSRLRRFDAPFHMKSIVENELGKKL